MNNTGISLIRSLPKLVFAVAILAVSCSRASTALAQDPKGQAAAPASLGKHCFCKASCADLTNQTSASMVVKDYGTQPGTLYYPPITQSKKGRLLPLVQQCGLSSRHELSRPRGSSMCHRLPERLYRYSI